MTNREYERMRQRAMKRMAKQGGLSPTEVAMREQYIRRRERIADKEQDKDVAKGLGFSLMCTLMALHDAFGFRAKRLAKFQQAYLKYVDYVQSKRLGLREFRDMCERTTGLKLEFKWHWEDDEL